MLATIVDRVKFFRVDRDITRSFAGDRITFICIIERVDDLDEFRSPFIALFRTWQIAAEILFADRRGHGIPTGSATAQMVQCSNLACEIVRMQKCRGYGRNKPDM